MAPETAALRINPAHPTVLVNITVPAYTAVPIALPPGASGDALELRLNVSFAESIKGPVGFSVRATQSSVPSEQTLVYLDTTNYSSTLTTYNLTDTRSAVAGLEVRTTSADPNASPVYIVAPLLNGGATGGLTPGRVPEVRRRCPPTFPMFLQYFRLYEVVSLHRCFLPYKYRKLLETLPKLMKLCEMMGSRTTCSRSVSLSTCP